ncbi:hypothetical protein BH11ARM2_BH11ARM2_32030 [soil metagenome]
MGDPILRAHDSGNPEIKELAGRLLKREAPSGDTTGTDLRAAFRVCQKLRHPLVTYTGVEGFRSLLARAVSLARAQAPLLATLRVNADGTFDFLEEAEPLLEGEEAAHAGSHLVSELLSLLATFIGPPLTLRMVRGVWPDIGDDSMTGEDS